MSYPGAYLKYLPILIVEHAVGTYSEEGGGEDGGEDRSRTTADARRRASAECREGDLILMSRNVPKCSF
jgi:hypothetical protein